MTTDRFPVCSHPIALASTIEFGSDCVEALTAYSQNATVILHKSGESSSFFMWERSFHSFQGLLEDKRMFNQDTHVLIKKKIRKNSSFLLPRTVAVRCILQSVPPKRPAAQDSSLFFVNIYQKKKKKSISNMQTLKGEAVRESPQGSGV